jgi:hypothetical protein
MLTTIAAAIKTRLEGLNLFKVVEESITKRALQSPPSAVFYLASDKKVADLPTSERELNWEIALIVNAMTPDKGQASANACIDAVRDAFTHWRAVTTGGIMPSSVSLIKLEGIENTLLVYSVRVDIRAIPNVVA